MSYCLVVNIIKHYSFFRFLKFLLILARMVSNFAKVSHLNVIPVAHRGSKLSKKHSIHSWSVYAISMFEKKCHLAEWGAFYKRCNFFQIFNALNLQIYLRYI